MSGGIIILFLYLFPYLNNLTMFKQEKEKKVYACVYTYVYIFM